MAQALLEGRPRRERHDRRRRQAGDRLAHAALVKSAKSSAETYRRRPELWMPREDARRQGMSDLVALQFDVVRSISGTLIAIALVLCLLVVSTHRP